MRVVVISHKPCWASAESPSGYVTDGGFPFQMQAISELFDQTILALPLHAKPMPSGTSPLSGYNLQLCTLERPRGSGWLSKIALFFWLPNNLPRLWKAIRKADAVHAPVPGDIGTIGLLVALIQHKPLFIRHCGTWGYRATLANHLLHWLLERIAGERNVVMATGGGNSPPSNKNPVISWIFSTTLSAQELSGLPPHRPWRFGEPLKLVTVARLDPGKNIEAIIRALPFIRKKYAPVRLSIVGDGPRYQKLKTLAADLLQADAVTFYGRLAHVDVLKVLIDSHMFVFPTRVAEGFPKAVHEALACGLPVIATSVSVLPHLVGNQCGLLLERTDPASVAEAILKLISDDKRLEEMSACAWQTSRQYTLEKWQEIIGQRLRDSWGPLQHQESSPRIADRK